MTQSFDRRVVPEDVIRLLRACQEHVPFHLGGGAALAGIHLRHRLSKDADLFVHDKAAHRELVAALPEISADLGVSISVLRDGGSFVRARATLVGGPLELGLIHESVPDIEAEPVAIEGILVESLADLRANKLTCILSRSEPRNLVDLMFLDRAGFPPEHDLELALRKDAGIDPGVLAWLLGSFPIEPLPAMLSALTPDELREFRDALRERFKRVAVP
ncbi:MAG: nucleotidyl transferase AbiEii/AbiGii toxin family protein [Polyangiaceae bacterium]